MDLGLLLLRLVVGLTMAAHGAQKLFGWFVGSGIARTAGALESMGFRPGRLHAVISSLAEFGGGVLLALGFLTPLGAAAILGAMIVAIVSVHWPKGFFSGNGGYEYNLLLIASAIALAFTGPGSLSLDNALRLFLSGNGWGFAAVIVGVLGAGVVLVRRRQLAVATTAQGQTN